MYKVFLYSLVFSILAFIVWGSFFEIEIKIALSLIMLTFLPAISKRLYSWDATIRKIKAALYASLFLTGFALLLSIGSIIKGQHIDFASLWFTLFLFLIFLLGSVVYGVPVSSFSDLATARVTRYRFALAFIVHLGFGLISYLFLGPLMYFALIVAVVFFLFDEFLRKQTSKHRETKMAI